MAARGLRTFSKNLRDNFLTSIAAVRAATDGKETFPNCRKDFFKSALSQADKLPAKYIVFGSKNDKSLNSLFVNHLLQRQIDVYELMASFSQDGKTFEPGSARAVPLRRRQFRVLQSIFEENETNGFDDKTTFYDISAWSTVHGYGIPFVKVKSAVREDAKVTKAPEIKGAVTARSELAYAFDYFDYLAPKALYYLQDNGVKARVAQLPFTAKTASGDKSFARGTIVIPVAYQTVPSGELFKLLNEAASLANITVYAVNDGFSISGIDLGSNNIRILKKPVVAVITGGNWTGIGELWALLGNTHNIPLVKIDADAAGRVDLSRYTTIILNSGQLSLALNERITAWVENGGTLIALSGAAQWASAFVASDSVPAKAPATSPGRGGGFGGRLNGIIVRSELNLSHPLTYGFTSKDFYTLKNSTAGLTASPNNTVLKINEGELVNGYATAESLSKLKNQVVIATDNKGSGTVLIFGESPTFRGYWLAPGRILTNALFFGAGGGRGRFSD